MTAFLQARVNGAWTLADAVREPRGFLGRGIGWMGAPRPPDGSALLFRRCRSLHLCFMRFPLDVVFLDENHRVVQVARNVRPWRTAVGPRSARHALELPAGEGTARLQPGDRVEFAPADANQKR